MGVSGNIFRRVGEVKHAYQTVRIASRSERVAGERERFGWWVIGGGGEEDIIAVGRGLEFTMDFWERICVCEIVQLR